MAYMMPHKLKAMKRKAGFDEEMETLCQQCPIRDWFREASVDQLEKIGLNPSTKKEWSIFSEAHAFLSEKHTFAWLQAEIIQTEDQSQLWNWQIVFWVFCMEMVGQQVRKARMYGIFRNITLRRKQANEDSNYKVG